jgi:hypothetical protein
VGGCVVHSSARSRHLFANTVGGVEETGETVLTLFTTVIMMLAQQYAAIGRTDTLSAISDIQAQHQRSNDPTVRALFELARTRTRTRGRTRTRTHPALGS